MYIYDRVRYVNSEEILKINIENFMILFYFVQRFSLNIEMTLITDISADYFKRKKYYVFNNELRTVLT